MCSKYDIMILLMIIIMILWYVYRLSVAYSTGSAIVCMGGVFVLLNCLNFIAYVLVARLLPVAARDKLKYLLLYAAFEVYFVFE